MFRYSAPVGRHLIRLLLRKIHLPLKGKAWRATAGRPYENGRDCSHSLRLIHIWYYQIWHIGLFLDGSSKYENPFSKNKKRRRLPSFLVYFFLNTTHFIKT